MSDVAFTGERLHEGSDLFGVDLVRHRVAYDYARRLAPAGRVLDMGCGSGYGTAELADANLRVLGVDRVPPDRASRRGGAQYLRADLNGIPLIPGAFDLVVSFQVIEHLVDPTAYLEAIARMLGEGGTALITTPNILTSDRENPFHVHEYAAGELAETLSTYFADVEMCGVGTSPPAAAYYAERLQRIRTITRLDPLRLREKLPRGLIDWLFARFAILVRRGIQQGSGLPDLTFDDFPIGAADDECIDLLAVCRSPR